MKHSEGHFTGPYTLAPETGYEVNGTTYRTDAEGRITEFHGSPGREAAPRSFSSQHALPGKQPGEDAGHLLAASQGGSGRADNLVRMDRAVNRRDYAAFERENSALLRNGDLVHLDGYVSYSAAEPGNRPDAFMVTRETVSAGGQADREYFSWTNADMAQYEASDDWLALADSYEDPGAGPGESACIDAGESFHSDLAAAADGGQAQTDGQAPTDSPGESPGESAGDVLDNGL